MRRIILETTIKVMERQRGRLSEGWCQASNIDEHGDSLGAYAEPLRDSPNDSSSQANVMLAQPHTDRCTLIDSKILDVLNAGLGRECNQMTIKYDRRKLAHQVLTSARLSVSETITRLRTFERVFSGESCE